jgi:hypothetical protein
LTTFFVAGGAEFSLFLRFWPRRNSNLPEINTLQSQKKSFQTFQTFQSTLTAFFVFGYPITVISGTTTGYVDTLILPPGMVVSNLPGGGVMLIATNIATGTSGGTANFSETANYATNSGFASNAGSLNGLPGSAYPTNSYSLTLYVSKQGSDSNAGSSANPFLTISNAVAKLSSNVYQTTTYTFAINVSSKLTNGCGLTFTVGTTLASRVTWTWVTNNPPGANQILIYTGSGGTSAKNVSNAVNLAAALTNGLTYSFPYTMFTNNGAQISITAPTGLVWSVGSDMTGYCSVVSNVNNSVTNFAPWAIIAAAGTYQEPNLILPPFGGIYGAGMNLTVLTNGGTAVFVTMGATNVLSDITIVAPAAGGQALQLGYGFEVRRVKTYSPNDGPFGGGGIGYIENCNFQSNGDGFGPAGACYIWDTTSQSIGPQLGFPSGAGARGSGIYAGAATSKIFAWNSTFSAGGNQWNAGFWSSDGVSGNTQSFYGCAFSISNNPGSVVFSNNAGCYIYESNCSYDRTIPVGGTGSPILHNTKPAGDVLNITNTPSAAPSVLVSQDGFTNHYAVPVSSLGGGSSTGLSQLRTNGDWIETWVNGSLSNLVFYPMAESTNVLVGFTQLNSAISTATMYSALISTVGVVIASLSDTNQVLGGPGQIILIAAQPVATNQIQLMLPVNQTGNYTINVALQISRQRLHGNLP